MLVDRDPPLELDESELFDDDSGVDMSPAAPAGGLAASLHAAAAPPLAHSANESESDDDGIVLDSDCSSSEAEHDDVEAELVSRIQSLQSSLEGQAVLADASAAPLGTSQSSQVGSLKTFGSMSFNGRRLFKSDGDLAASMPAHHGRTSAPMFAGRRQVAPERQASFTNLGTSMPISIPLLQRRASSNDLPGGEGGAARGGASTFVPPHMLHRQESEDFGAAVAEPSLGLSPGAGAKRERLMARNAILRSTGFIEVQQQRAAVIGEVLDPVKEQLLKSSGAVPLAVPGVHADARAPPRSSLTQLLGTSK